MTFETASGPRTLQVSIKKLHANGGARGKLELPERGMAILQYRAGEMTLEAEGVRIEPFEGEWVTIDLPASVVFETGDDSVLIDAIVIEE